MCVCVVMMIGRGGGKHDGITNSKEEEGKGREDGEEEEGEEEIKEEEGVVVENCMGMCVSKY